MKKMIETIILILILIEATIFLGIFHYLLIIAESDDDFTIPPEVKVSDELYSYSNLDSFWEPPVWKDFQHEYGDRYSEKLRQRIITNMLDQAEGLGENPIVLEKCIDAISSRNREAETLPCLAEKARFSYDENYTKQYDWNFTPNINSSNEIIPCWIIVFNWGFPEFDKLGHIMYYVISCEDYTILHHVSCT